MSGKPTRRRPGKQPPPSVEPLVRLREADIARIVAEVVAALRRERTIDDLASSVRRKLREYAQEPEAPEAPGG